MAQRDQRRARLIRACLDRVDAVLLTRLVNVRYLAGFTGSNAALLVGADPDDTLLATDGRYLTQAAAESPDLECVPTRSPAAALVERAYKRGVQRLGIEAGHVTLATYDTLRATAGDQLELIPLPAVVEPLRSVKDDGEIAALARACQITDAAFAVVVSQLRPGVTERDVAWSLQIALREHGADGPSFDSIVAFGPHSAIPHHQPTDRTLAPGELVKVDFGALSDGYHADMTRTVVMSPAAGWHHELHATVLEIQQACRAACTIGAVPRELDEQAAAAIRATGHDVAHGLGHGVGLEIHEDPFLTPSSTARPLVENVVLTIEPGIYLPGQGGVRIEDTLVTGPTGVRSMTSSPRELLEI